MAKEYDRAWKTIRVLRIGGVAFAFQQQHSLIGSTNNHNGGHAAFEPFPADRHRLVPLFDLIENEEQVLEAIEKQKTLSE